MRTIAIRRLHIIPIKRGTALRKQWREALAAELLQLGIIVDNPELFAEGGAEWASEMLLLTAAIRGMRGDDVPHVPLFTNFPDDIPDDETHWRLRYAGLVHNLFPSGFGAQTHKSRLLANGVRVPDWLFEIEQFGADPITQNQSAELFAAGRNAQKARHSDSHVEWMSFRLVFADEAETECKAWLRGILTAKSSIKAAWLDDIHTLLELFGADFIEPNDVIFKETRAFVTRYLWERNDDGLPRYITQPADLLRLFAALTGGDTSLSAQIRFPKMTRQKRKLVMRLIEKVADQAQEFARYRKLWLAIFRHLHPHEYSDKCPKTAQLADDLYHDRIATFESTTERLIEQKELSLLLAHLQQRPGVAGRKIHELLRRFPEDSQDILDHFAGLADKMTVKNLMVLRSYFRTINDAEARTVITKNGSIRVLDNNARGALQDTQLGDLDAILENALYSQLSTMNSWRNEKIYIDNRLKEFTVPLQQRSASDGLLNYGRGSKLALQDRQKVIRLFTYWKQTSERTDLDLSVIQFDDELSYCGHVSYTNLKSAGIVHSGDITSAPFGAAEFIDITLAQLPENVRYLSPQIYRYCGERFSEMVAHAGWMFRDDVSSDVSSFDSKTVANKFDLAGTKSYAVPFVLDVKTNELVLVDLYVGRLRFGNRVERQSRQVERTLREVMNFTKTRPTLWELAHAHVAARHGTRVDNKSQATISFGVSDCDYNATDIGKILSELL